MSRGRPPVDLAAMFGGAIAQQVEDDLPPRPSHEIALTTIKEWAADYNKVWKVGDIVTPKTGSHLKDNGYPHIVVEVLDRDSALEPGDEEHTSSPGFGQRLDTRVMSIARTDTVLCWWVESWVLEEYDPARHNV